MKKNDLTETVAAVDIHSQNARLAMQVLIAPEAYGNKATELAEKLLLQSLEALLG